METPYPQCQSTFVDTNQQNGQFQAQTQEYQLNFQNNQFHNQNQQLQGQNLQQSQNQQFQAQNNAITQNQQYQQQLHQFQAQNQPFYQSQQPIYNNFRSLQNYPQDTNFQLFNQLQNAQSYQNNLQQYNMFTNFLGQFIADTQSQMYFRQNDNFSQNESNSQEILDS